MLTSHAALGVAPDSVHTLVVAGGCTYSSEGCKQIVDGSHHDEQHPDRQRQLMGMSNSAMAVRSVSYDAAFVK